MKSRYVFLLTLILILGVTGVSCAPQGALLTATETAVPAIITASPSSEPGSPTSVPTLASNPTPTQSPSPITIAPTSTLAAAPKPSPSHPPSTLQALDDYKYLLIAQFGVPFYCDPDIYPVARPVTDDMVAQRVAALQKDPQEYQAILRHLGLAGVTTLTMQQQRAVYAESKLLNSITLEPSGDKYAFSLRVGSYGVQGVAISGTIDQNGSITVLKRESSFLSCPICLAVNSLIDTPQGQVPVQDIKPGMLVWSSDLAGGRRAMPVLETIRRRVPADFRIVQLVLDDGRELLVSPNHPTIDGRVIGDLKPGDVIDGARVQNAARVTYADGWTYDILPDGQTGAYWANGILLKSTLAK